MKFINQLNARNDPKNGTRISTKTFTKGRLYAFIIDLKRRTVTHSHIPKPIIIPSMFPGTPPVLKRPTGPVNSHGIKENPDSTRNSLILPDCLNMLATISRNEATKSQLNKPENTPEIIPKPSHAKLSAPA